jgi:tetratricopeptide (TPR) repeat protein
MKSLVSQVILPSVPTSLAGREVAAWSEDLVIDTYSPAPPSVYPAYLDRRVYQGSSGRVYPLPFFESINPDKHPKPWSAVHLDNEYVRLAILPELGGRIYCAVDKTRDYCFFYQNNVIKPALVGLTGPWLSGGVEFNWPQHHRPATYLPVSAEIEHEPDGSVTVWCTDHDPFNRMRASHGIRLSPASAVIECRVRLVNRSEDVQTFLWWANVAAPVGDHYQSFFPLDVTQVADHARRATATFPVVEGHYYGVDYPARVTADNPDAARIDWYRNIPVPTSYMCVDSQGDFFGGYDHQRQAGFVHWADHRIAPGKKQWTWGNAPFGWAWDRNLTDADGPYVELMAGVFTDNQPDFSYLAPGEVKAFSQYWYPIQEIGPAHQATLEAAVHLDADGLLKVAVTRPRPRLRVEVRNVSGQLIFVANDALRPGVPGRFTLPVALADTEIVILEDEEVLLSWDQGRHSPQQTWTAEEPPEPAQIAQIDELYLTGVHLEQYRHATRAPEIYWREALSRDALDVRSNTAMSGRCYRAGDLIGAETHARKAILRLTRRNAHPRDGEAFYRLGLALAAQGRIEEAYDSFANAAWAAAWKVPSWLAMSRLDLTRSSNQSALALATDAQREAPAHAQIAAIMVIASRRLGLGDEAVGQLERARANDRFDWWLRDLAGELTTETAPDAQTCLDLALEYLSVGAWQDALRLSGLALSLETDNPVEGQPRLIPVLHYCQAECFAALAQPEKAERARQAAQSADASWCFPGRLQEALMLQRQTERDSHDVRAASLLGLWLYAHDRWDDAMTVWRRVDQAGKADAVVLRCLAVGAVNTEYDLSSAAEYYHRALALKGDDAQLSYEADQLAKLQGKPVAHRLKRLTRHPDLVGQRDDLSAEYANLLALSGQPEQADVVLRSQRFQPWEGGEGTVLGVWERTQLALAQKALDEGDPAGAEQSIRSAIDPPESLGEARHLLANCADLYLMLGDALAAQGRSTEAEAAWKRAATQQGDFLDMATTVYSEKTYYSALAWKRLGAEDRAQALLRHLADFAADLESTPVKIDYFATSLPTMLLFHEDLAKRKALRCRVMLAQALAGLGDSTAAHESAREVLRDDPANSVAVALVRELSIELKSGGKE